MAVPVARKANWRDAEVSALVEGVTDRLETIEGKFSNQLNNLNKTRAWEAITER